MNGTNDTLGMSLLASQWRLSHIQVVNWGTFCGYQHLRLLDHDGKPADVCMITGESGTGKSTLFDAKTAVLMRSTARFNIASNQATGRARGSRERNLYSYVMGKQDDEFDPQTGEARESSLRSNATANWSAVFLTFLCDTGETYCAGRLYYVAAHATGVPDTWCITADTELDPRAMSAHADTKFGRASIRAAYPSVTVHDSQESFLRTVYRTLGIGRDGEGDSAMKLQERIQAGTSITDVDALFKDLVISEPTTYEKAEEACVSFQEHEATWDEMDKSRRKVRELSPIREAHEAMLTLTEEAGLLASCKPGEDGPLASRLAQRESKVFGAFTEECDGRITSLEQQIGEVEAERDREAALLDRLREAVAGRGGDALDRLRHEAEREQERLEDVTAQRARIGKLLAGVGRKLPNDEAAFDALVDEATQFLSGYEAEKEAWDERRLQARMEQRTLTDDERRLREELQYYRAHPSNISQRMAHDRTAISEATGIPERELPYAAELMDMADGEEEWRVAANVGFHGVATLLLVDRSRLDDFSVRLNKLRLNHRVSFQGVRKRSFRRPRNESGRLSSKLVFREESPFAAWLAEWVHDVAHDYQCVNDPRDLGGRGMRITREGQTRQRDRGAHGYAKDSLVIGFSNADRIARIEEELSSVRDSLAEVNARLKEAEGQIRSLERRRDVALQMEPLRWEVLDAESHERQLAHLTKEIERLQSDTELAELVRQRDEKNLLVRQLERSIGALQQSRDQEKVQRKAAHEAAQRAHTEWERLEAAGAAASAEQTELIDSYVAKAEEPFQSDEGVGLLARRYGDGKIAESITRSMRIRTRNAREQAAERTEQLEQVFGSYKEHWLDFDDPIGTGVDSYPDYLRILEELEQAQLDLHIDDWLVDTLRRAGASLAPLARAYTTDLREIRRRMEPINQIMGGFSFGPDAGHLEIVVSQRSPKFVRDFREELAGWAGLATQAEFEDIDTLHLRLRAFMGRLQEACERRASGPLNTKRLVYITVVAHYPDKPHVPDKAYSSLGAKSGGETQELIAFILGAALLFCLGDNGQALPAFAPVFLDEAFIKADERFTRRAINALTGLGFQVIIAVPTSKVQAVEPVATEYACITKDPVSNHSFVTEMTAVRTHA